jgi:myo-inositol-1(or 4)-monophosphatase
MISGGQRLMYNWIGVYMGNQEILEFIIRIVKESSNNIVDTFTIAQKGTGSDLVTNLDVEIEDFLISRIKEEFPDFDIVSEEGNSKSSVTKNCFVIDPIDGTINFANNLPLWGIQVACVRDSKPIAAVIYLPRLHELYYANESHAYLNDTIITINTVPIKNTLYSIDGTNNLPIMEKLRTYSSGRRNLGAVCVSMAFVSNGRLHGALFRSDKPWDYLPGLFIAKMAGAVTLDEPGFHAAAMNEEFLNILKEANTNSV